MRNACTPQLGDNHSKRIMENEKNNAGFVAGLALVISVVALFVAFMMGGGLGGSVVETQQTDFTNGLKVAGDLVFDGTSGEPTLTLGNDGSVVNEIIEGTGNSTTADLPHVATSSATHTLTVSGLTSSHQCSVSLPVYAPGFGGFTVAGVTASTDTLTFEVLNLTGAATSSYPNATTTVAYHCEN